jgi:hypothetical protein
MSVAELSQQVLAEKELARELERYVGKWIAVEGHRVVASAPTLAELLEIVEREGLDVEGTMQVPKGSTGACFF